MYRLDKTAFKAQTYQEADDNTGYWKTQMPVERLQAAWYLISCAYNFPLDSPPRIDKTAFSMRKHKQR